MDNELYILDEWTYDPFRTCPRCGQGLHVRYRLWRSTSELSPVHQGKEEEVECKNCDYVWWFMHDGD